MRGGETAATIAGKRAHLNYKTALGPEFDTKAILDSRRRPDAVDWASSQVRELKPDNQRAIARGAIQVERYRAELEAMTKRAWTSIIDTYRP